MGRFFSHCSCRWYEVVWLGIRARITEGSVVPSSVFPMLMRCLCSGTAQVLCVQAVITWEVMGRCKACDLAMGVSVSPCLLTYLHI